MAVPWSVTPGRAGPRLEARAWLRTVLRPGPDRWVWPVAGAAWLVVVWGALGWDPLGRSADHIHHRPGGVPSWGSHLMLWTAMVAATMLPLIAGNLRGVGLRSPRVRRARATVEVAVGWAFVWVAAGAVLSLGLVMAHEVITLAVVVGVVGAVAVAWQFASAKRTAVARCHRRFAPPLGAAATPACLRFGRSLGLDCLLSCWPNMALMAVAGHHLLAVVALGWLSWRDRRRPHDRPGTAISVVVLVGVSAVAVLGQA